MSEQATETQVVNQPTTNIWDDEPVMPEQKQEAQQVVEEKKTDAPVEQKPTEQQQVPSVDYNLYVKEKFGFDSEEVALAEIARLKEQKPTVEPFKFENEASEKFFNLLKEGKEDEVYSFLQNKKQLERVTSATIDNLEIASEIIKLGMQTKYKDLTKAEIDYKFNRQFSVPLAPKQTDLETDDEFAERLDQWKQAKQDAEMEILIEAKTIRPDLEKLKTELKLPELQKQAPNEDAVKYQEELARQQQADAEFAAKVPDSIKAFNGVNVTTTVKYGDVEIPISVPYVPSDAEKNAAQAATLESLQFLSTQWFDEQGVSDPNKVARDVFILQNWNAILQKTATESANQALEQYTKGRAKINVSGGQQGTVSNGKKNVSEQLQESIWNI